LHGENLGQKREVLTGDRIFGVDIIHEAIVQGADERRAQRREGGLDDEEVAPAVAEDAFGGEGTFNLLGLNR